jgi:hypothetical protein
LFVAALLLIPVTVTLLLNLPVLFSRYDRLVPSMLWLFAGFGFFTLLFMLFGAPVRTYILEHELSHLLGALITGVRVKKISLRRKKPYVRTERVTPFIALIPFALPLYTVVLGLAYRIAGSFLDHPVSTAGMYALAGVTLSFHLLATAHYLQLEQPDLHRYGVFASLVLISLWTLLLLAVLSALLFERMELIAYFEQTLRDVGSMYRFLTRGFTDLMR